MKVTRLGPTRPALSIGSIIGGGTAPGGTESPAPSGQVPTSNGSNGVSWGSNVAVITANGSNALLGPFVNFASGTGITFAAASNTLTISSTGGAAAELYWVNVEDYGAVHDGTTNDTAAIQAAIDAAEVAAETGTGEAAVWFPDGVYVVSGALQDTGRSNAQLLLPRRHTTTDQQISIRLFGNTPGRPIVSVGATTVITPTNGVIIKSTLGAGTGALLGCKGPAGSWQDGSAVHVAIDNISFRMPGNSTNTALDFRHTMGIELTNVVVDTGEYNIPSVTEPVNQSYGIRTPNNVVSSGFAWLRTVNVVGFWCGFDVSELANLDMAHAWACIYGFNFATSNHGILAKRIGAFGVQRGITASGSAGSVYVDVQAFETEHDPNPAWAVAVYDIDDPNNAMRGFVRFHRQDYGAAPGGMPLVNGAAGLSIDVGFERWRRIVGPVEMPNAPSTPSTPTVTGGVLYTAAKRPTWKDSDGNVFDLTTGTTDAHSHTSATAPGGGELLITDTPAGTPLVFADILQNEAEDDLIYSDS